MKKILQLIIISSLTVNIAEAIDLVDSYQSALTYNADYLAAIASNQAGQEQKYIARSLLLPQIGASASLTENYFNQQGMNATYRQPTYGAQIQQTIIDFSKTSQYTNGKYAAQLADLQLIAAKQQLMLNITQAYFAVLYAGDKLQATKMTKEALQKQMEQAQQSFKVGTVTIADVNDAQSGFDAARAQEIQDTNDLIAKKNDYRNMAGTNPEQITPLIESINLSIPSPNNDTEWWNIAKTKNINIRIANKQVDIAKENISMYRAGHYPTLNFLAQYQYQDTSSIDGGNITPQQMQNMTYAGGPFSTYGAANAGVQLSIPLSTGGLVNSQTRQAQDNYTAALQQQIAVERQTNQDIKNAYWQVRNGVALVNAQRSALESAKTKLKSDTLGYSVGVRNSVDLVGSQKDYYATFQNYQQSRYQYLLAKINLEYLSGMIDDNYIQQLNANINNL
ncbi:MAG: TolC family outer membrane protein [Burkholderiales bacterium]|nr:TolC family outer membrane protein [Burkholderiales bacterium]